MFDSKFVVTLLALMLSVIAICNFDKKKNIVEGLGVLPSFVARPVQVVRNMHGNEGSFYSVPNFQSQLTPRFSNTDYGANIKYNLPHNRNMATKSDDPLMMSSAVHENFETPVKCGSGGAGTPFRANPVMQSGFAAGNFNEVTDEVRSVMHPNVVDHVPVGDMTTVSPTGEMEQTIVYDRMIVANRNSNLRGQADFIRGDLPIPMNQTGWFQVSANPTVDLNQGAMNVLAGPDNAVTQEMTAFMNNSTGTTTVAGMNLSNQQLAAIGAGQNDVSITAFP